MNINLISPGIWQTIANANTVLRVPGEAYDLYRIGCGHLYAQTAEHELDIELPESWIYYSEEAVDM